MSPANIFSEEFAQAAASAGLRARQDALSSGHSVIFADKLGRIVEELPDGTKLEIRLRPGSPRETHRQVLGEIPAGE
jgi:hypothetical protein